MKKVIYFDTETTGINPRSHAIIQLSGIIEIDNVIKEEFNFKIAPFDNDLIDEKALQVNNYTKEQIKAFKAPRLAFDEIEKLLDKYINRYDKNDKFYPAGYNIRFDIEFLKNFFEKNFNLYFGSYFNYRAIDGLYLAHFLDYINYFNLPNYKLITVCDYYGIKLQAHDAMNDIRATRELILKIKSLLSINKTLSKEVRIDG